jgi:hypothetical protein
MLKKFYSYRIVDEIKMTLKNCKMSYTYYGGHAVEKTSRSDVEIQG